MTFLQRAQNVRENEEYMGLDPANGAQNVASERSKIEYRAGTRFLLDSLITSIRTLPISE